MFFEWKGLLKHRKRTTSAHKEKEAQFVERLEDLFDIAHANALNIMKIKEDKDFLISQRQKGRLGSIGGIDTVETNRRQKTQMRKEKQMLRLKRARAKLDYSNQQADLSSDELLSDVETPHKSPHGSADNDEEAEGSFTKRARINVLSPGLVTALDRTKVSSRNATYVLSEMAHSLGQDVKQLNINRNSIHRARESC